MSGIEVAALILGAIPVVIEAFDYSTQLFEPFRKYRRYVRDVQKLEFQIRTQRSIFVNNCVILLSSITGSEERAREMLQSLSLATSSDEIRRRLSSCRLESLGISLVACQDTIANLRASLDSLNKELVLFRTRSLGTSTVSHYLCPYYPILTMDRVRMLEKYTGIKTSVNESSLKLTEIIIKNKSDGSKSLILILISCAEM